MFIWSVVISHTKNMLVHQPSLNIGENTRQAKQQIVVQPLLLVLIPYIPLLLAIMNGYNPYKTTSISGKTRRINQRMTINCAAAPVIGGLELEQEAMHSSHRFA